MFMYMTGSISCEDLSDLPWSATSHNSQLWRMAMQNDLVSEAYATLLKDRSSHLLDIQSNIWTSLT